LGSRSTVYRPAWSCLLLFALIGQASAATLIPIDGRQLIGEIGSDGKDVVLVGQGEPKRLPLNQVAMILWPLPDEAPPTGETAVLNLRDGSRLTGQLGASSRLEDFPIRRWGVEFAIPANQVGSIEFGPLEPGLSAATSTPPVVIMRDGRQVAGSPRWLTWLEVGLDSKAGNLRLARRKIHRLQLANTTRSLLPDQGQVRAITHAGDAIVGTLQRLDRTSCQIQAFGQLINIPRSQVARLLVAGPALQPVTGLTVTGKDQTPYLRLVREPGIDRSLFGGPLRLAGMPREHGIALHSRSWIRFDLGAAYRLLVVDVGFDISLTRAGEARFVIRCDGKDIESFLASARQAPRRLLVPVSGVQQLTLLVDFGPGGSTGDHATWGEPLLLREVAP
jgi:hypothetical protein